MLLAGTVAVAMAFAPGLRAPTATAEPIKIGVVDVAAFAPVFIAQERGYFAAEGVPATLVPFDAAAPIAVATVSGDIDFGVTAVTAAFYNLAGSGELKIIAAAAHEAPGFHTQAFLVSRKAYDGGLKTLKDLPGHSFAVTGQGGPPVYVVGGLIAPKYGFNFNTIRIVPLQTMPNINSAIAGGRADFTASSLLGKMGQLVDRGEVKVIAWVGDVAPWQFGLVFTSTKTADSRHDTVERFLKAYRKGARDYHDATTTADGKPKHGAAEDTVLKIVAKYTKQSLAVVKLAIPYVDADARLDVKDVLNQVAFFKSRGLVKPGVDAASTMDMHYVRPLPEK
ncbi:MAG TPA: ABC transporter substrate-binding protein [Stellaceae bacterium]|nr:ABC transporter substrate-binding protein [Stellaceae bacterium]